MINLSADVEILDAFFKAQKYERKLSKVLKKVQKNCSHPLVIQNPRDGFGPNYRICTRCRLEERGTHWSYDKTYWWPYDGLNPVLGNSPNRVIIQLNEGEDYHSWRTLDHLGKIEAT